MWSAGKDCQELDGELRVELRHNLFVWGHWPLVEDDFAVFANDTLSYTHLISPGDNVLNIDIFAHSPQRLRFLVHRRSSPFHIKQTQLFEKCFDFNLSGRVGFLIHRGRGSR
jgi:hypothetical protein